MLDSDTDNHSDKELSVSASDDKTPLDMNGIENNAVSPGATITIRKHWMKKFGRKRKALKVIQVPPPSKKVRAKGTEAIDTNRCAMCYGEYNEEDAAKWAGCDFCERWFHTYCVKVCLTKKWKCPFHN